MPYEHSMLALFNAALLAQGQEELVTQGDGSLEWRLLFRNYPLIVEAELEDGRYQWTRRQQTVITRIAGRFGFADGYLVPSDSLHVRNVWVQDQLGNRVGGMDWISDGAYVYLDHPMGGYDDGVVIEYTESADEAVWGANFKKGVQYRLEALIAQAIKEEAREAGQLNAQVEAAFQRARTISSKERSARVPFQPGPLSQSRRGKWRG